jgi:hypothetical protein
LIHIIIEVLHPTLRIAVVARISSESRLAMTDDAVSRPSMHPAQICTVLLSALDSFAIICFVRVGTLADLELDMSAIIAPLLTLATAPTHIVIWQSLNRKHLLILVVSDEGMHALVSLGLIPVIAVLVFPESLGSIDISAQIAIDSTGAVHHDADRLVLLPLLIASIISLICLQDLHAYTSF